MGPVEAQRSAGWGKNSNICFICEFTFVSSLICLPDVLFFSMSKLFRCMKNQRYKLPQSLKKSLLFWEEESGSHVPVDVVLNLLNALCWVSHGDGWCWAGDEVVADFSAN